MTPAARRRAQAEFKTFLKGHLRLRPLEATALGLAGHDHRLEDISPGGLAAQRRYYGAWEARMRRLAASASGMDRLDALRIEQLCRFCLHLLKAHPEHGASLESVLDVYEVYCLQELWARRRSDWELYLRRLKAYPRYLKQLEANLRASRLPLDKLFLEDLAASLPAIGKHLAEKTPKEAAKAGSGLSRGFAKAGRRAQLQLEALRLFIEKELLPEAGEAYALGPKEYGWRLRHGLGVTASTAELTRQGKAILRRLHKRMFALARRLDPKAKGPEGLKRLMKRLAAKHPRNDREMLAMYNGFSERARRYVTKKKLFRIAPGYKLSILPTPAGLGEALTTAMYFTAPPMDASKKGYFLVSPSYGKKERLLTHNPYHAVSTAVHEAFPGHDMQYAQWQLRGDIPAWRFLHGDARDWSTSMNVEGYAHYAEELMRQEGFYTPREELFQLAGQCWRAARIVLDVGLHAGDMTVPQAARYLEEVAFLDPVTSAGEAFRYSKWPTQALTYTLGKIAIDRLKAKAKKAQGRSFSQAEFHERFLGFGPLPPHLVRQNF